MATAVACPKCSTKYSLPDNLLGKPVKCNSCGASFQVKAPVAAVAAGASPQQRALATQPQGAGRATAKPAASPQQTALTAQQKAQAAELTKMGLDGPIRTKPDIFGEVPHPRAGNPLGNHVVQDPGFADIEVAHMEEEVVDPSAMFRNPALGPKTKKKDVEHATVYTQKKKRKKKKRKIHPAVKESLDKATMTLFCIGALLLMIFGFFFFSVEKDTIAMMGEDLEGMEEYMFVMKIIYGIGIGLGATFCALGLGVQFLPVTCSILALLLYCGLELAMILSNPLYLFSLWGWVIRITIIGALGKAFMDALNARWFEQAQRSRD